MPRAGVPDGIKSKSDPCFRSPFVSGVLREHLPMAQWELRVWAQQMGTETLVLLLGDIVLDPRDCVGLSHWGFPIHFSKRA